MKIVLVLIMVFLFAGCTVNSPKHAYAIKTVEHGQCKSIKKGQRYHYKGKRAKYMCADKVVLIGKPYKTAGKWYFTSGRLDGKKIRDISSAQVDSTIRSRCHLEGEYGSGSQKLTMFYFDQSRKMCKPFEWSGKGGTAPFDSIDACEMKCVY